MRPHLSGRRGETTMEYVLAASLIAISLIAVLSSLADIIGDSYDDTSGKVAAATQ